MILIYSYPKVIISFTDLNESIADDVKLINFLIFNELLNEKISAEKHAGIIIMFG